MKYSLLAILLLSILYLGATDAFAGNCLDFDGTDDYVNCGNDSSLDVTDAFTFETWVHYEGGESKPRIVHKYPGPTIYINATNSKVTWHSLIEGEYEQLVFDNSVLMYNEWTHLAITYDSSYFKVYLNGVLTDTQSQTGSMTSSRI